MNQMIRSDVEKRRTGVTPDVCRRKVSVKHQPPGKRNGPWIITAQECNDACGPHSNIKEVESSQGVSSGSQLFSATTSMCDLGSLGHPGGHRSQIPSVVSDWFQF